MDDHIQLYYTNTNVQTQHDQYVKNRFVKEVEILRKYVKKL